MRISDWSSDVCSSDLVAEKPHKDAIKSDNAGRKARDGKDEASARGRERRREEREKCLSVSATAYRPYEYTDKELTDVLTLAPTSSVRCTGHLLAISSSLA